MGKKKQKDGEDKPNEPKALPVLNPLPVQEIDVIFGFAQPRPASSDGSGKGWRLNMPEAEILEILKRARIESLKLMPYGSNYTFLAAICDPATGKEYAGVYKPVKGEAPLWDFPNGTLYKRELGAYLVSRALDWAFIPPTVIREGPHGAGTMQLFVDADESVHLYQFREKFPLELQRIAAFDLVTNNADRKAGHCLLGLDGHVWGIDHGLCFNTVPKLRTIIWEFGGNPVPDEVLNDMKGLLEDSKRAGDLRGQLEELLERREVEVFFQRLEEMVSHPVYPSINSRRQVPWGFL